MTKAELKAKIKALVPQIMQSRSKVEATAIEYDELTKFPELKAVIVDLLGPDYAKFVDSIDWVAPKPSTFRINLLNGQSFYLVYNERSWVAEVEGKKYYLLNLNEEQNAINKIARLLRYGAKAEEVEGADADGAENLNMGGDEEPAEDTEEL